MSGFESYLARSGLADKARLGVTLYTYADNPRDHSTCCRNLALKVPGITSGSRICYLPDSEGNSARLDQVVGIHLSLQVTTREGKCST